MERKLIIFYIILAIVAVICILFVTGEGKYILGSLLNGVSINTPTSSNHYAYGENIGWIDFNPTGGSVKVGDNGLTGYAYGENVGWISLGDGDATHPPYANNSSTNWGVNNDGSGNLSGYAYGENIGWIDFNPTGGGVKINTTTGAFSGYAYGENIGWISFSGTGYGVNTDWRAPISVVITPTPVPVITPTGGGGNALGLLNIPSANQTQSNVASNQSVFNFISQVLEQISKSISNLFAKQAVAPTNNNQSQAFLIYQKIIKDISSLVNLIANKQ